MREGQGRILVMVVWAGLLAFSVQAQELVPVEVEPLLGAASDPAPFVVQFLGFRALPNEGEAAAQIQLLVENRSTSTVKSGYVGLRRVSAEGRLRQFKGIRWDFDLPPGASRTVDVSLEGFAWEEGERLVVGAVADEFFHELRTSPQRSRIQQLLDLQRRVAEPTDDPFAELERLRQERFSATAPESQDSIDLLACSQFCLDCAQIAAILCPLGTESLTCKCAEGLCEFTCR